jgi:hypothetical protein
VNHRAELLTLARAVANGSDDSVQLNMVSQAKMLLFSLRYGAGDAPVA